MKDYNVKITVRNNRILSAIRDAGYRSVRAFCAENDLGYVSANQFICMRISAIDREGRLRKPAQAICDALGALPEHLWSEEQLWATRERASMEYEVSRDEAMQMLENQAAPDELVQVEKLDEVLYLIEAADLTERELRVLDMRYKQSMPLEIIAKDFGVTRERIRQIEGNAILKIRSSAARNHYAYEPS